MRLSWRASCTALSGCAPLGVPWPPRFSPTPTPPLPRYRTSYDTQGCAALGTHWPRLYGRVHEGRVGSRDVVRPRGDGPPVQPGLLYRAHHLVCPLIFSTHSDPRAPYPAPSLSHMPCPLTTTPPTERRHTRHHHHPPTGRGLPSPCLPHPQVTPTRHPRLRLPTSVAPPLCHPHYSTSPRA